MLPISKVNHKKDSTIAVNHSTVSTSEFIKFVQQQIQRDLLVFLDDIDLPENLKSAVKYASLNGGKRARPALVYASYLSCYQKSSGKNIDSNADVEFDLNVTDSVRRCALAVELLHCYSLVHDDLPCMDDDDLRRGQPTCHIVHGEAVALLAGDVLQTLAFEALIAPIKGFSDAQFVTEILAVFTPRARRMVAGQMRDLNAENSNQNNDAKQISQSELEKIHTDKTGALIEASVLMGAVCARASTPQINTLQEFAQKLGLAFQVQDDILDITATTEELGKPAGSDEKLDKATYPKLMGLAPAKDYAHQLFVKAKEHLHQEFARDSQLSHFADWLWQRKK